MEDGSVTAGHLTAMTEEQSLRAAHIAGSGRSGHGRTRAELREAASCAISMYIRTMLTCVAMWFE